MRIKPIKCDADYNAALTGIDGLMGAAPETPEGDELEVLVTLVEACEAERCPIEPPDPISAIEPAMEACGLQQRDLAALIGSKPQASEVLEPHRPLTQAIIGAFSGKWNLPADVLVREYDLTKAPAL